MKCLSIATGITVLSQLVGLSQAFYLPGVSPTDYEKDSQVPLLVNGLTPAYEPSHQSLKSVISYDYYDPRFNFCQAKEGAEKQPESLGSILFGDRILDSPFQLFMLKNESCKMLCKSSYDRPDSRFVNKRILQDYTFNWLIDGIPAATQKYDPQTESSFYSIGFPLGGFVEEKPYLHNHYDIRVDYHETRQGKFRVVGVLVTPKSRANSIQDDEPICDDKDNNHVILETNKEHSVGFTYSVTWVESSTPWATRWDKYLHVYDPKIHWFSLVNSTIIVGFLAGMVISILVRALRKDIQKYNEIDLSEDVQEDSGWKLVHGDVFRTPERSMLLSIFLGSGSQLFFMAGLTVFFALLGFLSPSNRGSLATVMILFYTLSGSIGGYVSARFYKTFGGENWMLNLALTPLVVPGIIFVVFIGLNFWLIFARSSGAVPFGTMFALMAIWFLISVPLSALGSFVANKKEKISVPVRTNQIPRQIPHQPTYLKPISSYLISGILPFGAIFVELYFIFNSLWFHKVYYMFGFLFVCYGLMIFTCITVTILMTYFLLCAENYHWQWRSFIASGACAFYIFFHAVVYWGTKLRLSGITSNILYLGYSMLISFIFFILTGSVGFIASFFFVRKIYATIKID
ncbi:hypothetical protein NADFUDRAFT_48014 [Nadsonia fulvescens var. elongata DSM 6958]|uniref:Transmembrane 9 superfamily member n=1 Tax=Nadsonia fulvescens var. elongata DSM 6958 TaxID=857566 RepID=A0A1E3PE74_9ASCO|nr:hypothetical protein NADFUDRAFT_48014 [Nadsonia fulvescens var. elongata DSM 6958]